MSETSRVTGLPAGLSIDAWVEHADGELYNASSKVYEAFAEANQAQYAVALVPHAVLAGVYVLTLPVEAIGEAGTINYTIRSGEAAAKTDRVIGSESIDAAGRVVTHTDAEAGSGLPGPGAVSLAWVDADGAAVPSVQFTLLASGVSLGSGIASTGGTYSTGLADGSYMVRTLDKAGLVFPDTTLTVADGAGSATMTGSARQITPAPSAGQTTAYLTMRDAHGSPLAGATLQYHLVSGPNTAGVSLDGTLQTTAASAADGLLQVVLYKECDYRFRRMGSGAAAAAWRDVSTRGSGDTLALPQILSQPA